VRVDQREYAKMGRTQAEWRQDLREPRRHALPVPREQKAGRAGKWLWGAIVKAHL
jgi:hypothetical protein